jgi:ribonucleotide reductase alpha subunit
VIIDMAADRGAFICQGQSMNLWIPSADADKISNMILYAWRKGLKTLCYYLHVRSASDALAYTASTETQKTGMMGSADRYSVTTTLAGNSLLGPEVNPLHPIETSSVSHSEAEGYCPVKPVGDQDSVAQVCRKRKKDDVEDDDDEGTCLFCQS